MASDGAARGRGLLGAVGLAAAVAVLAGGALAALGRDFCLDDAWIHLAYARSLHAGDGLSYNPGDWETGFSSPAWVILLAATPFELAPVATVKALGVLLHAVTAAGAARVGSVLAAAVVGAAAAPIAPGSAARRGLPGPGVASALVAGGLVAIHPVLLQGAVSGMEVSLAAATVVLAMLAVAEARPRLGVAVGALAALTRVETLPFVAALSVGGFVLGRRRSAFAPLVGGAAALGVWVLYCAAVTGHPWPNTRYVKAVRLGLDGLGYLTAQVLPSEPWAWGLAGAVLVGLALRRALLGRERAPVVLFLAWGGGILAVALSRKLDPFVHFYALRYFAPFAVVPPILVAVGASAVRSSPLRRGLVALAFVATAVAAVLSARRTLAQEEDIEALHTRVAAYVRDRLPPDAVVAVEGAGALRYATPRSMTIVDVLGLNERSVAHARDDYERICSVLRRQPRYFVLPDELWPRLAPVLDLRPLARFTDASYVQTDIPRVREVFVLELVRARAPFCARRSAEVR